MLLVKVKSLYRCKKLKPKNKTQLLINNFFVRRLYEKIPNINYFLYSNYITRNSILKFQTENLLLRLKKLVQDPFKQNNFSTHLLYERSNKNYLTLL